MRLTQRKGVAVPTLEQHSWLQSTFGIAGSLTQSNADLDEGAAQTVVSAVSGDDLAESAASDVTQPAGVASGVAAAAPADGQPDPSGASDQLNTGSIVLPEVTVVATPPASFRSAVGSTDYYRLRNSDFVSRADAGEAPPSYYLGYGDRYVNRFKTVLRPNLSPAGQAWVDCTVAALQTAIEDRRDANPWAFAELERDGAKFQDFCYGAHADAYVSCGVCALSIVDELKIVMTPDFRNIVTMGGLKQCLDAFLQCQSEWFTPRGPAT
jgi:hypothetical protein